MDEKTKEPASTRELLLVDKITGKMVRRVDVSGEDEEIVEMVGRAMMRGQDAERFCLEDHTDRRSEG